MLTIRGTLFEGVHRGTPLVDIFYHRLIGLLGYEPYKGTMNIRLEGKINFKYHSSKAIDQILLDGSRKVDAWLAPVVLHITDQEIRCYAIKQPKGPYGEDVIEILSKRNLKTEFGLKDGDTIEITFTYEGKKEKRNLPGTGMIRKLFGQDTQLMK